MYYTVTMRVTSEIETTVPEDMLDEVLRNIREHPDATLVSVMQKGVTTKRKYVKHKDKSKEYVSLAADQIVDIKKIHALGGATYRELAEAYGVSRQTILNLVKGRGRFSRYQPQPVELAA